MGGDWPRWSSLDRDSCHSKPMGRTHLAVGEVKSRNVEEQGAAHHDASSRHIIHAPEVSEIFVGVEEAAIIGSTSVAAEGGQCTKVRAVEFVWDLKKQP